MGFYLLMNNRHYNAGAKIINEKFLQQRSTEVFKGLIINLVSPDEEFTAIRNSKHGVLSVLIAPKQKSSFA
jgi:hypothetical protein